ncbi:putative protein OS=Tsukamurella paurometabola (strain ATCC 8368 / DSM / CCUG 35730 /CIP 100753 / JCM 10117 / KCTC 9821 / NBRC 16120 / NCIMB 702349/ NCTC 13040) OX=521096 GN=Tpau_1156 PE=4 SV=1 [Tsukamurella paurometabola]|uniref:SCO6045-like C-terminal domain-containing protein n=1 Tax=Tsukamurella paurometabola (strain ATCC 8368 / DSM 20162 / CCUG 35730 / CIP 100753 / JCM 10117 / KCTC 9821 / NBRC 16120 / NCIMB 702349 / NCTC 13040) TaxID=521096 RepID=D5UVY0_TSUPD|nr:hypothetical protein [Tsukamurella paurometabola]ADG77787.1 conserved hypothetical protein [Tsukamurella paurometabola DSM 20162]SUP28754.1 Uncharacterised protein [Tsukamurella paurometabola]
MVRPDARERLRRRQSAVLDDLLAARVPAGFDARAAALTSRVLAVKRAGSAGRACPSLRTLGTWPHGFVAYAATHPKEGCSAHDARAYITWLRAHGTAAERSWVAVESVRSGARRWAVAGGRPVVRIGAWTVGVPATSPTPRAQ